MKTVLLIDDNIAFRHEAQILLERSGLRVFGAASGAQGASLARAHRPEIVVCRREMRESDGYSVLRLLLEKVGPDAHAFLMIVTQAGRAISGSEPGSEWVDEFVLDSVTPPGLVALVHRQVDERKQRRAEVDEAAWQGAPSEESAAEIIGDICGLSDQMLGMMEKFLKFTDLSLLMNERIRRAWSHPGPVGVIHSNQVGVLAALAARRMKREGDVTCYLDRGFVEMEMDELSVVVGELVENACRYSTPGSAIDVFFLRNPTHSEICVRDHGRGMSAAQIDAIRNFSEWSPEMFEKEQAGLGLPIVKLVSETRGGGVRIASEAGLGTMLRVVVPTGSQVPDTSAGKSRRPMPPFGEESWDGDL